MYKIGVMVMGKPSQSPKKVKQIILQVQAKTKVNDILTYMLQLQKINNLNVNIAIQKGGRPVSQSSTIAQILRHTKPINNVIKLYLYDNQDKNDNLDQSTEKIVFKQTKHQKHLEMLASSGRSKQPQIDAQKQNEKAKNNQKYKEQQQLKKSSFCCC